jgi:hypothetical protein
MSGGAPPGATVLDVPCLCAGLMHAAAAVLLYHLFSGRLNATAPKDANAARSSGWLFGYALAAFFAGPALTALVDAVAWWRAGGARPSLFLIALRALLGCRPLPQWWLGFVLPLGFLCLCLSGGAGVAPTLFGPNAAAYTLGWSGADGATTADLLRYLCLLETVAGLTIAAGAFLRA